jgi:hypothetical protein
MKLFSAQNYVISTLRTRFTNKKQQFGLRAQPALEIAAGNYSLFDASRGAVL